MAYEVTATRRRPGRFEDLIGQEFVVATLQKSIAAGKIAHAYLFSGPRGCGKTSSARILARALNCDKGPGPSPCGVCPSCLAIARGSSMDVIEIDGASNTSVNDVRQIKDEVQFPPNSCRYKVYIIDEVHMLSSSAFNALLKTIEEPPPYVIFIFATTELHKVPATIKSRCQQFNFRLVPVELLKESLAAAASETGIKADDDALYWIAREATGSVRDAYTLFDQVAAFSDGHITFEKIEDKLGLVGIDRINRVVSACAARDAKEALSALDEILDGGVSVEQFTVDLADYLRGLLLLKSGVTRDSLLGQSPDRYPAEVVSSWSAVHIERALGLTFQLYRDIRYTLEPRYELELAVSRLAWIADYVSAPELKDAISRAQALLQGAPTPGQRGAGPFVEADRPTGPRAAVTVRPSGQGLAAPDATQAGAASLAGASPQTGASPQAGASAQATGRAPNVDSGLRPTKPDAGDNRGDDEPLVQDPFAALKERMSGRSLKQPAATVNAQPAPASPAPATPVMPAVSASPTSAQQAVPAVSAPAESPTALVPPATPVDMEALRQSLVSGFEETKNMLAVALSQTANWMDGGAVVGFTVGTPFTYNYLEQERKTIAVAASRLMGRQVDISISLKENEEAGPDGDKNEIPPMVEALRQMFRGTLVGEGR